MRTLQPVTGDSARPNNREELAQLKAAPDRISLDSQAVHQLKEGWHLIKEQEVIRESLDRGDGPPVLCQRWPNHGTSRQTLADKFAGLGQNQVRLIEF
jgi:hypothetical protein